MQYNILAKIKWAYIVLSVGMALSILVPLLLLWYSKINFFSFCILLPLMTLLTILLVKQEYITKIDFKKLSVEFKKIEEAKEEVSDTEKRIRQLALDIAELQIYILGSESKLLEIKDRKSKNTLDFQAYYEKHIELSLPWADRLNSCNAKIFNFVEKLNPTEDEKKIIFKPYASIDYSEGELIEVEDEC